MASVYVIQVYTSIKAVDVITEPNPNILIATLTKLIVIQTANYKTKK